MIMKIQYSVTLTHKKLILFLQQYLISLLSELENQNTNQPKIVFVYCNITKMDI